MAKRKRTYEVRVTKSTASDYADIAVQASSKKEARALAIAEAKRGTDLYFGPDSEPTYDVEAMDEL